MLNIVQGRAKRGPDTTLDANARFTFASRSCVNARFMFAFDARFKGHYPSSEFASTDSNDHIACIG